MKKRSLFYKLKQVPAPKVTSGEEEEQVQELNDEEEIDVSSKDVTLKDDSCFFVDLPLSDSSRDKMNASSKKPITNDINVPIETNQVIVLSKERFFPFVSVSSFVRIPPQELSELRKAFQYVKTRCIAKLKGSLNAEEVLTLTEYLRFYESNLANQRCAINLKKQKHIKAKASRKLCKVNGCFGKDSVVLPGEGLQVGHFVSKAARNSSFKFRQKQVYKKKLTESLQAKKLQEKILQEKQKKMNLWKAQRINRRKNLLKSTNATHLAEKEKQSRDAKSLGPYNLKLCAKDLLPLSHKSIKPTTSHHEAAEYETNSEYKPDLESLLEEELAADEDFETLDERMNTLAETCDESACPSDGQRDNVQHDDDDDLFHPSETISDRVEGLPCPASKEPSSLSPVVITSSQVSTKNSGLKDKCFEQWEFLVSSLLATRSGKAAPNTGEVKVVINVENYLNFQVGKTVLPRDEVINCLKNMLERFEETPLPQNAFIFAIDRRKRDVYDIVEDCLTTYLKEKSIMFMEMPLCSETFQGNLLWNWGKVKINRDILFKWQRINHYVDIRQLTRKDLMYKNIERYLHERRQVQDVVPKTFILPRDYMKFIEFYSIQEVNQPRDNIWISKPFGLSRGRGISILKDLTDLSFDKSQVIQRYISNPLLLNKRKFDLRLYVLITSLAPLKVYLHDEGFIRTCFEEFSVDLFNLGNKLVHLTNTSIQKRAPFTARSSCSSIPSVAAHEKGKSKLSLSYLWRNFAALYNRSEKDMKTLKDRIDELILISIKACVRQMSADSSSFELLGFDILINEDLKPWLIEVNSSPSLLVETDLDLRIKRKVLLDVFKMLQIEKSFIDYELLTKSIRARLEQLQKPYIACETTDILELTCSTQDTPITSGFRLLS
eukprot:augustus_masked-scaffold_36-processed-gene-2.34-mRNA-1 protein AED:0.33 eAED:0.33 QI:0/-1/0/1/-1/1/1/0/889